MLNLVSHPVYNITRFHIPYLLLQMSRPTLISIALFSKTLRFRDMVRYGALRKDFCPPKFLQRYLNTLFNSYLCSVNWTGIIMFLQSKLFVFTLRWGAYIWLHLFQNRSICFLKLQNSAIYWSKNCYSKIKALKNKQHYASWYYITQFSCYGDTKYFSIENVIFIPISVHTFLILDVCTCFSWIEKT